MIGSPWNPFYSQTIPGTVTRYDGRTVDSGDDRQFGAFDAVSAPQYLQLTADNSDVGPVILTRQFDLLSTGSAILVELGNPDITTILAGNSAETLSLAFGKAWGTRNVPSVLKTGFCWWYHPTNTWNSLLPRFLYKSDPIDDYDRRYWFAAGVEHPDGSVIEHGEPFLAPQPWQSMFTAWIRSDGPPSLGGRTVAEQLAEEPISPPYYYELFGAAADRDADVLAGSRQLAPADINSPFSMPSLLPYESPPTVAVRPWYYNES